MWNNTNDLDLHCIDPSGEEIFFAHRQARSAGNLDVDKNADCKNTTKKPVENIFWPSGQAPDGRYQVLVNHFAICGAKDPTRFKVSVLVDDKRRQFEGRLSHGQSKRLIYEFTLHGSLRIAVPPNVVLLPGASNKIRAMVSRQHFHGPVRLHCEGDMRGLSIADVKELASDENEATFELSAESAAEAGAREIRMVGQAGSIAAEEKFVVQVEAVPPTLRISVPPVVVLRGNSSNTLRVRVARERFLGPVELRLKSAVEGITLRRVEVPESRDEGELQLTADERAGVGRHSLRLQAASGPFRAEADVAVVITAKPKSWSWSLLLVIGFWTGLLGVGLSLALAVGQNWYLSRRLPRWQQVLALAGGGMLAGLVAGGIGQALFSLLAGAQVLPQLGFLMGWGLLGGLLGRGIGFFIPNLHGGKAALAGAVGGLVGAGVFISVSAVGDIAGRCVGAAILGLSIGLVVALIEAAFRDAWLEVMFGTREMRTVNLGPEPIRIGSDSSCLIWTPSGAPVAIKFWINNRRVMRQDVPANQTHEVAGGHREKVGTIEIFVRTGKASNVGSFAPRVAPPPPVRKPAPAVKSAITSPTTPGPAPKSSSPAASASTPKRPPPPSPPKHHPK
jgi:hypothetical protein